MDGRYVYRGLRTETERKHHINVLQLKGGAFAVKALAKDRSNIHIRLRMDNMSAVAYLNHLGGTSSQSLAQCACQIWQWCLLRGITLSAEHIPGTSNLGADRVSLTLHSSEWKLYPKVCTQLLQPLGPGNVDLFVSRLNNQLGRFISWRRDPFAITTDSFQSSWQEFQGYAHFA